MPQQKVVMVNFMPKWWRWCVLGATLYMNCVVNGYTYCFGLLKLPLMDDYPGVSALMLALVGGAVPSIYMLLAPIAIAMSECLGIRYTTMFASFISSICFFLAWANGAFLHCGFLLDLVCLGVGQGVSFSLLYGPSVAILPQYFPIQQLAFAAGIANAGSSIGVILFGFISNPLFSIYGWRGAMLVYACISLQGFVAGMIFIPKIPMWAKPQAKSTKAGESTTLLPGQPSGRPQAQRVNFCKILARYFDSNLFKRWPFICLMGAAGCSIIGYFVPTLLLPGHARQLESSVSPIVARNIMAIFGVLNLTGRVVLGKLGDLGMRYALFSAFWLYEMSLIIGAFCFLFLAFFMNLGNVIFVGFAIIYGFCAAPIITMRSILTTTLFGKKNANASYGWFLCTQGAVQLIGYVLPAWLDDAFGCIPAYSFAMLMFLVAALFCGAAMKPYFRQRQKQIGEIKARAALASK